MLFSLPKPSAPRSKRCSCSQSALRSLQPAATSHDVHCAPCCSAEAVLFNAHAARMHPTTCGDSASASMRAHSGSRWQPSKPRPPQFRRGVSCICMVSAGPPEGLGRNTLTVSGICHLSVRPRVCQHSSVVCQHSLLRSGRRPLQPATASRGLSSPPSQTL